jgi:serine/threonine-protein kinase RsbT
MGSAISDLPRAFCDAVALLLDPWVGAITACSVITSASRRSGVSVDALAANGFPPRVLEEVIRGLSIYVRDPVALKECRRVLGQVSVQPRAKVEPFNVPISNELEVVEARTRVRSLAEALGFAHTDQIRIATAVSEVARNIYSYAGAGTISAGPRETGRTGVWIRAADKGPGIHNLEQVLSGSYRSRTGMGLGLNACRRLMDAFNVVTAEGRGTVVTMEKYV